VKPTGVIRSGGIPDPNECRGPSDVGKVHYNETDDIWYECVYDKRRDVVTWAIVPSTDSPVD
jgi:hypothetical protein